MKFNTGNYKLSLFTEDVCEECKTLKNIQSLDISWSVS